VSKFGKALVRLQTKPKDFTWRELQTILTHFGYQEIKGDGSRRKFVHSESKAVISLHEPHPNPVIKKYALEIVLDHLKQEGLL
jgi:predicted RNA binding protein YcfA (HicA-like mRNA interferase family)